MTVEDQIKRLIDLYLKEPDSVNYRILSLNAESWDNIRDLLSNIQSARFISEAKGQTLDNIGRDLGVIRGGMDDIKYRRRLKLKFSSILSAGEIERLNELLTTFLGAAFFGITEGWIDTIYEPAAMLIRFDHDVLFKDVKSEFIAANISFTADTILLSVEDVFQCVNTAKPAGVRLAWLPVIKVLLKYVIEHLERQILKIKSGYSFRFDGSEEFDGNIWFDGGYSNRIEHLQRIGLKNQFTVSPKNKFDGVDSFNGGELFDSIRAIVIQYPHLGIKIPGELNYSILQSGKQNIKLLPTFYHFDGNLQFNGQHRFDGYTALNPSHHINSVISSEPVISAKNKFEGEGWFNGQNLFDADREFAIQNQFVSIKSAITTEIIESQSGKINVGIGPYKLRFDGNLAFNGDKTFYGLFAVKVENEYQETVKQEMETSPVLRFDINYPFSGELLFNGTRNFIVNDMAIEEVTA